MPEKEIKQKFKVEFSMGELDYNRFNEILKAVDTHGFLLKSGDVNSLRFYYSSLYQLYINWRPILFDKAQKDLDNKFLGVDKKINAYFSQTRPSNIFLSKIIQDLTEINLKLIKLKQVIGLGVPLKQAMTGKAKTSEYLLGQ